MADGRGPPFSGRWVKDWVTQELIFAGGRCSLYRWIREDELEALKDKHKEEAESEPATEVLFLCTFEGCGKIFVDAGSLRKHTQIHGERQHVCHFEGCGKKFMDSSKLKRHYLIHTGEKNFICTYVGCGKAFSLDFNLKAHMKTHLPENYHLCPYDECGRRFTQESKLKGHIRAHHEKTAAVSSALRTSPKEIRHVTSTPRASMAAANNGTVDRPYACPYDGCEKAYIHEYKLNLHLRKEHPGHAPEPGDRGPTTSKSSGNKNPKRSAPSRTPKMLPAKVPKRNDSAMLHSPARNSAYEERWMSRDSSDGGGDSEETEEEDQANVAEPLGYAELSDVDDDETDED